MRADPDTRIALCTLIVKPKDFVLMQIKGMGWASLDASTAIITDLNRVWIVAIHTIQVAALKEYNRTIPWTIHKALWKDVINQTLYGFG